MTDAETTWALVRLVAVLAVLCSIMAYLMKDYAVALLVAVMGIVLFNLNTVHQLVGQ